MVATLFVGRSKSVLALNEALQTTERKIMLVSQKEALVDEPTPDDLYTIGSVGRLSEMINLPDGTVKVLIEGLYRAKIVSTKTEDDSAFIWAESCPLVSPPLDSEARYIFDKMILKEVETYAKYNPKITPEFISNLFALGDLEKIIDTLAIQISLSLAERQKILETISTRGRAELALFFLKREIETAQVEDQIRERVKTQMGKNHREYYLQEQIKAIQKELNKEDGKDELSLLEKKIEQNVHDKEAKEKGLSELKKLRNMNAMSAEASVIRSYLEWLVDIPWKKATLKKIDLEKAEKKLNQDHYGLEKVKERVLEFLAVQKRFSQPKAQIICFVGPPGVGKTSLARSIAEVTGRPYVRAALGGVHDESEIRGHRRTYIGAMPGKIIQGMKKAKTTNPLFLLDEIDKLGTDWRGDPSSALLEVLDPEQNKHFNDHYLEVDYDLSNVMFLATANSLNIPLPLLDRMEIIHLGGYTEDEKLHIALEYLLPKQKKEHGLKASELDISKEALRDLIRFYTRESGVRGLERSIAALCRKTVRKLSQSKDCKTFSIQATDLENFLGPIKYTFGKAESKHHIGTSTGLSWSELGGDLLHIEAVKSIGTGKLQITGKLGEVMQESIKASLSYIRSRAADFNLDPALFEKIDIHVHVPEGATPKEGPSAGITISTALVSLLTNIPIYASVAMTGEITLRGKVLGIGGLKEKLLAAQRGGIHTVLIPQENQKDLVEIPETIKSTLAIIPVSTLNEVLKHALTTTDFSAGKKDFVTETQNLMPNPSSKGFGTPAAH